MSTYKVIQDIEAEDKLLGPLTLRQFIYAVIVIVSGFIAFRLAAVKFFLAIPFLPLMIFFGVLAAPFGHDQPSEIWLLAKVRFFLKPRRRIWDQSGVKQLVTITAPKRIEKSLTKDLSQVEVKSRLRALADTIDSRGWAVKNVNVNLFSEPSYVVASQTSDRLVSPSNLPQDVPTYDVQATDDIMDETSNPTAQYLNQMIAESAAIHKQQAIQQMKQAPDGQQQTQADYWFLNDPLNTGSAPDPGYATFTASKIVKPGQATPTTNSTASTLPAPEEQALLEKIHAEEEMAESTPLMAHMKPIQSAIETEKEDANRPDPFAISQPQMPPATNPTAVVQQADSTVTVPPKAAIIELANNDDLDVATLSRQAEKAARKHPPTDEVVITLR